MITLLTKDGTKTGNAIIYGGYNPEDDPDYRLAVLAGVDIPKHLFLVETDFGNRMRLTWKEIEDWYTIGRVQDYYKWREDRLNLVNNDRHDIMLPSLGELLGGRHG